MERHKVAVIGLGRISSTIDDEIQGTSHHLPISHTGSYVQVPEVELVAAADTYAEQREAFGRRYGLSNLYSDYREMLEKERPEIVSVCTSAKPRADIVTTIAEMDSGVKAIWTEKPISVSLEQGDAMVAACRKAGIKLAINCSRRWDPWYNQARAMIDSGAIGEIIQVNVYMTGELSHNSHALNLARYLAGGDGKVSWVFGEMENDETARSDDDLGGNCYLAFESGARAYVMLLHERPGRRLYVEADVIGSEGRIKSPREGRDFEWWRKAEGTPEPELCQYFFPRPQWTSSRGIRAVQDLIQCIETGKEPNNSGDESVHDLEVAVALRESHRQGGRADQSAHHRPLAQDHLVGGHTISRPATGYGGQRTDPAAAGLVSAHANSDEATHQRARCPTSASMTEVKRHGRS